jgi:hypothetical protein
MFIRLLAGRSVFGSLRRREFFSLRHRVHTGSGIHPFPYRMGNGASFPGVKRPGREADLSPPSSAEVKMRGAIPPFPYTSSWRGD